VTTTSSLYGQNRPLSIAKRTRLGSSQGAIQIRAAIGSARAAIPIRMAARKVLGNNLKPSKRTQLALDLGSSLVRMLAHQLLDILVKVVGGIQNPNLGPAIWIPSNVNTGRGCQSSARSFCLYRAFSVKPTQDTFQTRSWSYVARIQSDAVIQVASIPLDASRPILVPLYAEIRHLIPFVAECNVAFCSMRHGAIQIWAAIQRGPIGSHRPSRHVPRGPI
jgi:hypothetical protein